MAKLEPLLALGVPSLGIFFDDVPPPGAINQQRYADLGEAQADSGHDSRPSAAISI